MDFYNDAIKEAKKQNVELSEDCKEILLSISITIQDMDLREKRDFLGNLLELWKFEK